MRWTLVLLVLLTGCSAAPAVGPPGWPRLPATVTVATTPPPALPTAGPVGRGALIYTRPGGDDVLVLEDGHQYGLPASPTDGRQGGTQPSLSSDGRWLGRRASSRAPYLIRDLLGDATLTVDGVPVAWSPDGRLLLVAGPDGSWVLVEPGTASTRPPDMEPKLAHLAAGVLPDGRVLTVANARPVLQVGVGRTVQQVTFAESPDDECWCPSPGPLTVSPDGMRLALLLHYERGLVAGTSQKSAALPGNPTRLVILERMTAAERLRVDLPASAEETWRLLADPGTGILLRHRAPGLDELVLVDPDTGGRRVVTRLPPGLTMAVPGEILYQGE